MCLRALGNQLALEFGQRGEYPEHQASAGGGGVDHRPLSGEDFETDPTGGQLADGIDQMAKATAEPAEMCGGFKPSRSGRCTSN